MNLGFLDRVNDITDRTSVDFGGSLWKLQMEKGIPYNVGYLSEVLIDLPVHFVLGAPPALCNKIYFEAGDPETNCEDCKKPGYQNKGLSTPALVKAGIGYVFDLKDKKDKNKKGREFVHNPEKIIEVFSGKKKANFDNLNIAVQEGYVAFENGPSPVVWRLKRLEDSGMAPPAALSMPELKKLSEQFRVEIPKEVLEKYSSKSREEIIGIILSTYGNCKREHLEEQGVIFPVAQEASEDKKEESPGDDVSSKLD